MKAIIIIYLLIIIFSLAKATEFGKYLKFTKDYNNAFYFTFEEEGSFFVQVDYKQRNALSFNIEVKDAHGWTVNSLNTDINPPGNGFVIHFKKGDIIKLKLTYKSKYNIRDGLIWMYPSTSEIKVDLKQRYEFKYDYKETLADKQVSDLTFSIDNAEEDKLLEFYFNDNFNIYENSKAPNPIKIFHNNYYIGEGNYFFKLKKENLIKL